MSAIDGMPCPVRNKSGNDDEVGVQDGDNRNGGPTASPGVSLDDVAAAYRWILGRAPESPEVMAEHQSLATSPQALRALFLNSAEFRATFGELPFELDPTLEVLDAAVPRWVFLHLPKTGGTTVHGILGAHVEPQRICRARYNNLLNLRAAEVASASYFSGHFDRRALAAIPGRDVRVFTMLREPRARLVSLYQFFRAHSDEVVVRDGLDHCRLAKQLGFGDFLREMLRLNPGAVDNVYLRCLAWQSSAQPQLRIAELGHAAEAWFEDALSFLRGMAAVGVMERFDASLQAILSTCGLEMPARYDVRLRLSDLVQDNREFVAVAPVDTDALDAADAALLHELTHYDARLYAAALAADGRQGSR